MYNKLSKTPDFQAIEEDVRRVWKSEGIFLQTLEKDAPEKIFYDGPPFPTGTPHYGTVFVSILKDLWARYFTMRGFRVPRRWGWDCHGLPIETAVEKSFGITNKQEIEERIGVDRFNDACRSLVSEYNDSWETYIDRIGRWVDYSNAYRTMDTDFMESVVWAFAECYKKGLIYKDYRVTPYCYRCQTSLSASDTRESDSTRPRVDTSITFKVALDLRHRGLPVYALVWTTTPWTVPANLALGVNPGMQYGLFHSDGAYLLASTGAMAAESPDKTILGAELAGIGYTPVFSYYTHKHDGNHFTALEADFVNDEEGTGIVHLAPAFGEDDYWTCRKHDIGVENPVDQEGRFTDAVVDFAGRNVHEANEDVADLMQRTGVVVKREQTEHNYPHCWRCRTPLIYRAMDAWYFNIEKIKDRLIEKNREIRWVPETVQFGRFGNWLEGARDWNISRNRYWGTPIPVWECENTECRETFVPASKAEIEHRWGHGVVDLHKQHLDPVTFSCTCGATMRRVPEVLDNWFESGAMPYGQRGYPFKDREWFDAHFPADYIIEYTGQLRAWFYYLHVLSVALFDRPAFVACLVHGTLLAEDGTKMSKSKGNYTDPLILMDSTGADALRLYLCRSPAAVLQDMRFEDGDVVHQTREILLPLWNAVSFYVTYANIDQYHGTPGEVPTPTNPLDRWILSRTHTCVAESTDGMEAFDSGMAVAGISNLIDDLTNWYIRRSRKRYWVGGLGSDKSEAFDTLYYVLVTLIESAAPVVPFLSEHLYRILIPGRSVHLAAWPAVPDRLHDLSLEATMAIIRTIASLGLSLRQKSGIKVRQPLPALHVVLPPNVDREAVAGQIAALSEELNIKQVSFVDDPGRFARIEVVPDPRRLGPKYGKATQEIIQSAKAGNAAIEDGTVRISGKDGRLWTIPESEVTIRYGKLGDYLTERADGIVVVLDTAISPSLREEGVAMELNRAVQEMRKAAGYEVADRIVLDVEGDLAHEWKCWLAESTLALLEPIARPDSRQSLEVEGRSFQLSIKAEAR
jgi:isoleucyl-tRNA synthetase